MKYTEKLMTECHIFFGPNQHTGMNSVEHLIYVELINLQNEEMVINGVYFLRRNNKEEHTGNFE